MKNIKTLFCRIVASALLMIGLIACHSSEDRAISKLNRLAEKIDKHGQDFSLDDWAEAMEELADIHEDMEECEFTNEQLKEVGRIDGRLSVIIAREGAKALGKETVSFLDRFNAFAVGVKEGVEEKYDESEFQQIEEGITHELDSLDKDWEYLN